MTKILIGIDDTDTLESSGTGRMARDLAGHFIGLGMGTSLGATRHQLLVDERIPYTSHNSSLCIGMETENSPQDFFEPGMEFLRSHFREGSDPGLCISLLEDVPRAVMEFGIKAQQEVLTKKQAIALAAENGIFLVELGGTGGGIIGALSGVGLRAEGNSGRFVDLPGIRDIGGMVTVSEIIGRTDIDCVMNMQEIKLGDNDMIDSRDWVRPTLLGGRPVLLVRPRLSAPGDNAWTSVEIRERDKRALMQELFPDKE